MAFRANINELLFVKNNLTNVIAGSLLPFGGKERAKVDRHYKLTTRMLVICTEFRSTE